MAEGLLGAVLGDEEERPEIEPAEVQISAQAFAAAVAAIASRQDLGVARKTETFLEKQSQLLETQHQHLQSEHALRTAHLRNQLSEENLRRLGLRLRPSFQLLVASIALAIGVGVLLMIHDALTSRKVVVEPFHAPPALIAMGIDGVVAAGGLLDELRLLQDATFSSDEKRDLSNAWASEVKLEVPETGLSLSEVNRLLIARFGHDVHIDGDVVETAAGGLVLSVRGDHVPPKHFDAASTNDLAALTSQAAQYVYAKSQPRQWATYLSSQGRNEEAIVFCRDAYASADAEDRPGLLNTWGISVLAVGGTIADALALLEQSLKLKPDNWITYTNIINALMMLGDERGAWQKSEEMVKAAGGRPGKAREYTFLNTDYLSWNLPALLNEARFNADTNGGVGGLVNAAGPIIADVQVRLHDFDAASLALKTTVENPNDPTISAATHFVLGRIAFDSGDFADAVSHMEAFGQAFKNRVVAMNFPGYMCWIAPALEAAGLSAKADAVLASAGTYVDCGRFRGDILDKRGDWPASEKAYANAVALAPELPAAYFSWAEALARHRDFAGAIAKYAEANQRQPHWADPLKGWGDALIATGKKREAAAKYRDALKYAPNWPALHKALIDADALAR
jgi:tetratricopeptide (TPR) repeat protein